MRSSPSGPLTPIQNPYPGISSFSSATTVYMGIHSLSGSATEVTTQTIYPRGGKLISLEIQIFIVGTDAVTHTWNVRKNGVLVPGMAATLFDNSLNSVTVAPSTVDGSQITATDLISLEMVPGTFAGVGCQFRSFLNVGVPR